MQDAVREIVVRTEAGETLRLMTNDLDAPAQEIADLYRRRWQIELFFRLMKQTLRITKFVGRSENAVRIRSPLTLIAFLLPARPATNHPKKRMAPSSSFNSCARQSHASKRPDTTPKTPASPAAQLSRTSALSFLSS